MSKDIMLIENKDEIISYSDDSLFNITSFGTDLTFREIISMYEEGDLEKPELQRKYVWTKNEASRFIDSILLGLPVPSIFLAKTPDEKRLIIDGYQRIMTVFDYVNGIFSGDAKIFKLSNTDNINKRWRGKAFKELLPEEQRKIKTSSIHAIVFEQKHPQNDTGMYQIFERINTGGRILKPQEIRNCVYQGNFNTLLIKLNKNSIWRSLLGSEVEDSRMADMELVLRFFAFCYLKNQDEIDQNQINLTKYLNKFMSKFTSMDQNRHNEFESQFITTIDYLYEKLNKIAFRSLKYSENGFSFTNKLNPVIFDAVCAATSFTLNNYVENTKISKEEFKNRYHLLLTDEIFLKVIKSRTTNIDNIKKRIEIATLTLFGVNYEW